MPTPSPGVESIVASGSILTRMGSVGWGWLLGLSFLTTTSSSSPRLMKQPLVALPRPREPPRTAGHRPSERSFTERRKECMGGLLVRERRKRWTTRQRRPGRTEGVWEGELFAGALRETLRAGGEEGRTEGVLECTLGRCA